VTPAGLPSSLQRDDRPGEKLTSLSLRNT
jgi:hypothetical protein